MKAPDKITIGKHNIDHNGDVVFAWIELDDIPEYVEYIRKDYLLEWAEKLYEMYVGITEQSGNDIDFGRMNAFSMIINKLNEL